MGLSTAQNGSNRSTKVERWRPFVFDGIRSAALYPIASRTFASARTIGAQWARRSRQPVTARFRCRQWWLTPLKEWRLACPRSGAGEGAEGRLWLVFPNGNGNVENHANIANRGFYALQHA